MPREQYEALDALNWSKLKLIERSPAHFREGYGGDSSGFALGTVAHAAVLEPERFAADFVVYPGKTRRGKEWEEFESQAIRAGKTVVSRSEHAEATAIAASVRRHPRANALLSGGQSELTITWELAGGGLSFKCKGRADYVAGEAGVDLKTTRDASPAAFARSCAKFGYFGQIAWYSDGLFLATGVRRPFYVVPVESEPPYIVQVYRVTDACLEYGRAQYLALLGKLDYCQKRNWWGGYTETEESDLELPRVWGSDGDQ